MSLNLLTKKSGFYFQVITGQPLKQMHILPNTFEKEAL
jgi:hypothetical protein